MPRMPSTLILSLLLPLAAAGFSEAKRKPAVCPTSRYLLDAAPLIPGGPASGDAVVVGARTVSIDPCGDGKGKPKRTGKGTRLEVRWKRCGDLRQVQLDATIVDDCATMQGTLKARKQPRKGFSARRSTGCGDGLVDPGLGEECDGAGGCGGGGSCSSSCVCQLPPPTTSTTPPVTTTLPPTTTTTSTLPPACGNGALEPGESCDDGNATPCDGCSGCQIDRCGDAVVCAERAEQCDDGNIVAGDGCSELCESEGSTCLDPAIGSRLVVVSIDTPRRLAGVQLVLDYPQLLSSIPGVGTSSLVQDRVTVYPRPTSGSLVTATADDDTDLTTLVAAAGPPGSEFIGSGPLVSYAFDNCVEVSQNVCNRAQTVVGCCNDPADPNQFGNTCARYSPTLTCTGDASCPVPDNVICTAAGLPYPCCTGSGTGTCTPSSVCTANGVPLGCCTGSGTGTCTQTTGACLFKCPANPPLCAINGAISNFSTTSVQPCAGTVCSNAATRACIVDADCVAPGTCTVAQPAGACPGDNACVPQSGPNGITSCFLIDPVDALAQPVAGVTCSVTVF